ncbi:protein of unknown function (DUF4604) domain containing protein [Amanita muscaria]
MAPKEPTRAQLSSRLSYSQHTPSFLRRLQNQVGGHRGGHADDDDEYANDDADPEFEDYDHGSGRPPIPRRPEIPERPPEDPGSAGEDDEDEKPQVVVLKEGKHLNEREAENIRRKAKGLPPLPDPQKDAPLEAKTGSKPKESSSDSKSKPSKQPPLSFSTSKSTSKQTSSAAKRKLEVVLHSDDEDNRKLSKSSKKVANPPPANKKQKKKNKTLLSFGDDA